MSAAPQGVIQTSKARSRFVDIILAPLPPVGLAY